jgi:hypothetical protein
MRTSGAIAWRVFGLYGVLLALASALTAQEGGPPRFNPYHPTGCPSPFGELNVVASIFGLCWMAWLVARDVFLPKLRRNP